MPSLQEPEVIVKYPGGNTTKLTVEGDQFRMYETRHEDDHYRLQAIIPLQDAIQFAVTLLEFVKATAAINDEEAMLLDWIRREEDKRAAMYDGISAHFAHD